MVCHALGEPGLGETGLGAGLESESDGEPDGAQLCPDLTVTSGQTGGALPISPRASVISPEAGVTCSQY